ncbi:MAG: exonuclease domain-containing protein [Patescibacteria group bacterium]
MDELIFLDTETTGNDLLADRLFQVCYKHNGKMTSEYFKPPVPISVKSQSITHVTNKMVADKPAFKDSQMKKDLHELLKTHVMVAHNAVFDIAMLVHEEVSVPRFICTLKIARYLDKNGVIPEYNLQYLRYYLELDVEAQAHEAEDDVKVVEALFKRQYAKMLELHGDHAKVVEEMIKISLEPSLFTLFPFGKHKGRKIEEVIISDRPYVEWLLEQKMQNPDDLDWIYTLKFHLKTL